MGASNPVSKPRGSVTPLKTNTSDKVWQEKNAYDYALKVHMNKTANTKKAFKELSS